MNDFVHHEPDIRDTLRVAALELKGASDSPRLDAEILLARALDVSRSYLIAHPEDCPDAQARSRFTQAVEQRACGVPLAYIVGEKDFWSLTLMVTPATLVPRPETELLVEKALANVPLRQDFFVADLGTGSGAIALSIARERPRVQLIATDSSADALAIAQQNARKLDIANVEFRLGRWTEPVAGEQFDLVVSNPPYVRADDPALAQLTHEPQTALVSGREGLDDILELAAACQTILKPCGLLLIEHGAEQREAVAGILSRKGWSDVHCFNDLAGHPRVTRATFG